MASLTGPAPVERNPLKLLAEDARKERHAVRTVGLPPGDTHFSWPRTQRFAKNPLPVLLDLYQRHGPVFSVRILHGVTVFALGPGKKDVNILWAGSDDGLVNVTRDGGKSWSNVTPRDMPDFGRVSIIDASAFDPGGAYVAVKKPLLLIKTKLERVGPLLLE